MVLSTKTWQRIKKKKDSAKRIMKTPCTVPVLWKFMKSVIDKKILFIWM